MPLTSPRYDSIAQSLLNVRTFFQKSDGDLRDIDTFRTICALTDLGLVKGHTALLELRDSLRKRAEDSVEWYLSVHQTVPDVIGLGDFESEVLGLGHGDEITLKAGRKFKIRYVDMPHYLAGIVDPKPKKRTKKG